VVEKSHKYERKREGSNSSMSDGEEHGEMEDVTTPSDFFDQVPSNQERIEVSFLFCRTMELGASSSPAASPQSSKKKNHRFLGEATCVPCS
jgi:hypothetical protein